MFGLNTPDELRTKITISPSKAIILIIKASICHKHLREQKIITRLTVNSIIDVTQVNSHLWERALDLTIFLHHLNL